MATTDMQSEVFGISAVSRLTGISTHVLRVWERRYGVVEPGRSNSKRREYTRDEIRRLSLIKSLVDHGHAIRNVAGLTTEQLEARVRETVATEAQQKSDGKICRVAFSGAISRDALRGAAESSPRLRLVGDFSDLGEMQRSLQEGSADLVVAELPYLFPEAIEEIQQVVDAIGARRAIVIYRFASSETIGPLDKDIRNVTALRAPVDEKELKMACLADLAPLPDPPEELDLPELDGNIPARKFSEEQLAKIARFSTVVQCECPQHLASLLSGLAAFEAYSADCENRNEEDAKLHAYLHQATAECRSDMEKALEHLLVAEGIEID